MLDRFPPPAHLLRMLVEPALTARAMRGCLECFVAIDRTMAGLAAIYQRAFAVVPQFRAALHCGPVIVSECGSAKRQLAFFGDTMNVTARLCEYCKQASQHLVVSADLLSLLTIPSELVVGNSETIALRGRHERSKCTRSSKPVKACHGMAIGAWSAGWAARNPPIAESRLRCGCSGPRGLV
jgi:hypothetical protein